MTFLGPRAVSYCEPHLHTFRSGSRHSILRFVRYNCKIKPDPSTARCPLIFRNVRSVYITLIHGSSSPIVWSGPFSQYLNIYSCRKEFATQLTSRLLLITAVCQSHFLCQNLTRQYTSRKQFNHELIYLNYLALSLEDLKNNSTQSLQYIQISLMNYEFTAIHILFFVCIYI